VRSKLRMTLVSLRRAAQSMRTRRRCEPSSGLDALGALYEAGGDGRDANQVGSCRS
jgi:hypothetical protein